MKFRSESVIAHPRAAVFSAFRDQLPDIASYLDDISEIRVVSRSEADGIVTLHNEWASNSEIPAVARSFIKPENLRWDDHAIWDASAWQCRYDIKTRAFVDAVTCVGTNTFVDEGETTRVVLEGEFTINVKKLGIPSFIAGRVAPQIESFIIGMVKPNLEKTNAAVGRFLDAQ